MASDIIQLLPVRENMPTITIPKTLIKEKELVIIPRKEYEAFLQLKKFKKTYIRKHEEIKLTPYQKSIFKKAERRIASGEFYTINELKSKLGIKN